MGNAVIVAIPRENDRVWKRSSEKVPHLTLLFLGDSSNISKLDQLIQFVQHAVDVSEHGEFMLEVDHREPEFGADKADVLIFRKDWGKWISSFRNQLLQNDIIRTAYDSVEQFPEWQPHLTLGYPETPAKEDTEEFPNNWVTFDRIAVWTGDYEGPEFRLEWPERMEDFAVAYSSMNEARVAAGREMLEHHGVKGMKWGVRKERVESSSPKAHILVRERTNLAELPLSSQLKIMAFGAGFAQKRVRDEFKAADTHNKQVYAARKELKKLAKGDKKWEKNVAKPSTYIKAHNAMADEVNAKLPGFNNDKRWKDVNGNRLDFSKPENADKKKEYETAFEDMTYQAFNRAVQKHYGTNPSGTRMVALMPDEHGALHPMKLGIDNPKHNELKKTAGFRHAAEDDEQQLPLLLMRTDDGYFAVVEIPDLEETSMAQTADLGAEFLAHYGVKGMKWGVRKAAASTGSAAKTVGRGVVRIARDTHFESETARRAAAQHVSTQASIRHAEEDLPKLKAKYAGTKGETLKGRMKNPLDKDVRAYRRDARIMYRDRINEEVAKLPTNASGTRKYEIEDSGKTNAQYMWTLKAVDTRRTIDHADVSGDALPDEFTVRPVFDEDGFITNVKFDDVVADSVTQTADLGADFLAHYGIKGMRWGHRKEPPAAVPTSAMSHVPHGAKRKTQIKTEGGENHPAHEDAIKVAVARAKLRKSGAAALSNQELREVANRLQLEQQVSQLTTSGGKKFVANLLKSQRDQEINARFNVNRQNRLRPQPQPR